ncbi:MAG: D-alanyl-D-alanine carboxypeptidase family protein [Christensenellales bacterium]
MKKFGLVIMLALTLSVVLFGTAFTTATAYASTVENSITDSAKASFMIDYATGSVISAKNENERLQIASMMKIMTALITFEEIDAGRLSMTDEVVISENAHSQGGSQVFLDAGATQRVEQLIESVIVASANDSCVALAEHIAGSVEGFVVKMNEKAAELNMENTHFANCTGLPASENFSCAKDVATMTRALISHPDYFKFSQVWLKDFEHQSGRKTTMTNTNKLVRFYKGCDGGKTGFTNEAGFCLSATAERDGMRLIAVVIGEKDSKTRFKDVSNMLNYGFANFENTVFMDTQTEIENSVEVKKGKTTTAKLKLDSPLVSFAKRGETDGYEIKYELPETVKAPLNVGDKVGKAYLVKDGAVICESNVVIAEKIEKATFIDDLRRIFGLHK